MSIACIQKDPQAVLPYSLDWSYFGENDGASTDPGWLQGDTIASSSWSVSGPDALLVVDSDTNSTTVTTVYLSGGTIGFTYTATNHVITSSGHEDGRSIRVTILSR